MVSPPHQKRIYNPKTSHGPAETWGQSVDAGLDWGGRAHRGAHSLTRSPLRGLKEWESVPIKKWGHSRWLNMVYHSKAHVIKNQMK